MRPEPVGKDLGSAAIYPDTDIRANAPGEWRIVYTCGRTPVTAGGIVRFEIPYGFTPPQTAYPSGVGYTAARCSRPDAQVDLALRDPRTGRPGQGTWGFYIFATVKTGRLNEGDALELLYGRGDGGA